MNIYEVYKGLNETLLSKFRTSKGALNHSGGKGSHLETEFKKFLSLRLPDKYAIGSGELLSSKGEVSKQCDVVIYDTFNSPKLFHSDEHSVFANETVFGVIELKSSLESNDLNLAIQNIISAKMVSKREKQFYGAIVGFTSNRSIEAIIKHIEDDYKNNNRSNTKHYPDYVVVLDQGIIKTGCYNGRCEYKKSNYNAFLHFLNETLGFLNKIELKPLDLGSYLSLPELINEKFVENHNYFISSSQDANGNRHLKKMKQEIIDEIYSNCQKEGLKKIVSDAWLEKQKSSGSFLAALITQNHYIYNPNGYEIIDSDQVELWDNGRAIPSEGKVYPQYYIIINGEYYYYDYFSLKDSDFEPNNDLTSGDLNWNYLSS